jgi:hypothetical protein
MSDKQIASFRAANRSPDSVTFAVEDVVLANSPQKTCKPLEAVQALLDGGPRRSVVDESAPGNPIHGRAESCWSYSQVAGEPVGRGGRRVRLLVASPTGRARRSLRLRPQQDWTARAHSERDSPARRASALLRIHRVVRLRHPIGHAGGGAGGLAEVARKDRVIDAVWA